MARWSFSVARILDWGGGDLGTYLKVFLSSRTSLLPCLRFSAPKPMVSVC
jgi:hypothetical protein